MAQFFGYHYPPACAGVPAIATAQVRILRGYHWPAPK
jgi:hypothetical protein